MAESVWVLGVSMLKFGRYPDKDTVDLGSQAALDAMDDAGVTIHDMGVMGVGCLYEANAMLGQRIQKLLIEQIGHELTAHSVYMGYRSISSARASSVGQASSAPKHSKRRATPRRSWPF